MSWRACREPECVAKPAPVTLEIKPRPRDLGGFEVARVLPSRERRMVGPFIFFDHMGPANFDPEQGADVRPHPHIGLSTLTYLFEGAFLHRDSLGTEQLIEPGAVNWMTAGRGIAHSERTPAAARSSAHRLHGLQSWVAMPRASEEDAPSFQHCGRKDLPEIGKNGVSMRLLAGSAFGETSPVTTFSPSFYLDVAMPAKSRFTLPAEYSARALYPLDAPVTVNGIACDRHVLAVLEPATEVEIATREKTRLMLLGGKPLESKRFIWWNFVSSSRERIETAKRDWAEKRFPKVVGDEHEYV